MKRLACLAGFVAVALALGFGVHRTSEPTPAERARCLRDGSRAPGCEDVFRALFPDQLGQPKSWRLAFGPEPARAGSIPRWFSVTTTSGSPVTGTAPGAAVCTTNETSPTTTGLWLDGCSYVICEIAVAGTFSGAGTADTYWWNPIQLTTNNGWSFTKGSIESFSALDSGKSFICFPARNQTGARYSVGCLMPVPNGVTTGGGATGVTTTATCIQ